MVHWIKILTLAARVTEETWVRSLARHCGLKDLALSQLWLGNFHILRVQKNKQTNKECSGFTTVAPRGSTWRTVIKETPPSDQNFQCDIWSSTISGLRNVPEISVYINSWVIANGLVGLVKDSGGRTLETWWKGIQGKSMWMSSSQWAQTLVGTDSGAINEGEMSGPQLQRSCLTAGWTKW